MRRTHVLRVLPDREQQRVLRSLSDRTAALWNSVQYRCRQAFFAGERVPGYAALCREFQEHPAYTALPSDIAQETIKKARKAWSSFFALRRLHAQGKVERRPRPPRYWKDRRTGQRRASVIAVKASRSFSVGRRAIALTLPKDMRSQPGDRLVLRTRGLLRLPGEPKTLELRWDRIRRRWYAHVAMEAPDRTAATRTGRRAAIDLGARVLAAVAVEGQPQVWLYGAREVWKDYGYWERRIACEQARLARSGRRWSRTLGRLHQVQAQRLRHAAEALARQIAHRLRRIGVAEVVLEELTGIRQHMDFGHRTNLLVHGFWVFAALRRSLEAALGREHIRVVSVEPRGSSSRCHRCGGPVRRPIRRKVGCGACGALWHADGNAAMNLLGLPPSNGDGAEAAPAPAALRWNRHRWMLAGAESVRPTRPAARVA